MRHSFELRRTTVGSNRKGECRRAVGEHRSLSVGLHDHDDSCASSASLQLRLNASVDEGALKRRTGCIVANRADESSPATCCRSGDGNVRRTAASSSRDRGGRVASTSPRGGKAHGNLLDEVPDADDQGGGGEIAHVTQSIGYPPDPWAVSSVG